MPLTQANRLIAITTPLDQDALLLQSFVGQEGLSRLFHFEAELVSEDPEIRFDQLIGKEVGIRLATREDPPRYIHGHVSRFTQSAQDSRFTYYRAHIVPWLWFLTRTADCRIFQAPMTVPDIISKIFDDLEFDDYRLDLQGAFEPVEYCVQYRETDFNFVSRLMEDHGIFYFFEHEEKKHTLVLGNHPGAHPKCPGQGTARCAFAGGALEGEDVVTSCQVEQELRPGRYAITDYNFETPSTSLAASVDSVVKVGENSRFEVYDYPGEYGKKPDGERLVKLRIEEEEATHFLLRASSTCRAFVAGQRFDLAEHYRRDLNGSYLLIEVQHGASAGEYYTSGGASTAGETYTNSFTASPHSVPYRPARVTPRPLVQGTQTAVVVGPSGEEIYSDSYGRVKVQFHWDREGERNENSSCWIRVSQPWAGKNWGAVAIPRIGQEVIVDFLEGDPDRPIIVGRVYNAELMPPYDLPAGGVVSGFKSKTHKGSGYNEFSMDDTVGKEKIVIHGQYDMETTIEHDQKLTVHNNRSATVDVDDSESVGVNQSMTVGVNQKLDVGANQDVSVGANATRAVGISETHSIGVAHTLSVGAAQAINVGAAQEVGVGGVQSVNVGASQSVNVGGGQSVSVGGDQSTSASNISASAKSKITHKAGSDLVIDAGSSITIKCGGATITMKGGKISIKGTKVSINGSGGVGIKGAKIGQN